ncbi:MAG: penicillin-binding protein 2 [Candidatus Paceibacterota bacterium]|jgi:cell division protein FtsI/penicillin-binding protein 2
MNSKQKLRTKIIFFLIVIGAVFIAVSLYWIQIVRGDKYAIKADEQYIKQSATTFDRGSIYFLSKEGTRVSAAALGSGYVLFVNPTLIASPSATFDALSQYIKLDKTEFIRRASKPNDLYEELSKQISEKNALSIKNLGLAGVGVKRENWRSYPGGSMAAHEIGIIGEDASSTVAVGRYGLERFYESVLSRTGASSNMNAFAQIFSGVRDSVFGGGDDAKGDIITTIEPATQKYLEKILSQTSAIWRPDEIGGVIIDPSNGEILAMSSLPTFDPNNTALITKISVLSNPLVENSYEMGSIMKPLTMAAGFDVKAITPKTTYDDTGTIILNGKTIGNYDKKARGITNMQEVLSQSLNMGAAWVALKIGKDDFAKYFSDFGIGSKTGIDQPNETVGIVGNLKSGRDVEIATAAYGQGLAISPIAMTRALSVLASGGYLITPHLAKEMDFMNGTTKIIEVKKGKSVLRKETTDEVTRMLVKVVDESMSVKHPNLRMERYSIAAKTGTAQIPDHTNGGYYSDRYLHSFFGYFPAYNPKFLVFLYQVHPKGAEYASETLIEPFGEITKYLINYYNVAPDR